MLNESEQGALLDSPAELADSPGEELFQELYQKLNTQQKLAVDTTEGPVMVIAGAGTGKTQILAMRIARILRNPDLQMDPQNILCLTFTESGVAAMRKRLMDIIGSAAYYVRIHTFHSFCNEIIKEYPEKFTFASRLNKLDHLDITSIADRGMDFVSELEQIEILNGIIDKLPATSSIKPYGEPYFYRRDLLSRIQELKREAIKPEDLSKTIDHLEAFLETNQSLIQDFISRHARTIKENDCEAFLAELAGKDQTAKFIELFNGFYAKAEKISAFKKQVKDFYEKSSRDLDKQRDLVKVYRQYQEALIKRKLYDFDDMVLWVTEKLESDPELLARYQEQFQYILVDEYQDTNGAQNKILELITSFHGEQANIFVVGDDDQSIYRFQGASVENIVYFYKRYKNTAKFVVLEDNYRSHQTILDASHSIVSNNQNRISNTIPEVNKQLKARANIDTKPIDLCELERVQDESLFIADKIQELINSGVEPKDIAVLYRKNRDVDALVDLFSRMSLPFQVRVGNDILQNIEITHLLDLLKVIDNPKDDSLLFNVLNYNFMGLKARDIYELTKLKYEVNKDAESKQTLIDLCLKQEAVKEMADKLLYLKQQSLNMSFDEFFELVIKESGFLNYLLNKDNKIEHLNRLNSLFDQVKMLSKYGFYSASSSSHFGLKDFLKYIELLQENRIAIKEQQLKTNANAVNLMTAHRSKGLEFDYVFIVKAIDKQWGNVRDMSKLRLPYGLIAESESHSGYDNNEDERRLFYVALTRAKKHAYITCSKTNDSGKATVPSIFVEEIDKTLLNKTEQGSQSVTAEQELDRFELLFANKQSKDLLEEEREYAKACLENYKLSVTHLNNYLTCPRLFFYRNLIRVPSAKNKHASFGTAVHAALYDLFVRFKSMDAQGQSAGDQENLDFLLASFEKHLAEESLAKQDHQDSLEFGKQVLQDYFENYKSEFNRNSLLEFDFSRLGLSFNGMPITGKLDKIEIVSEENKTVNVVDYKTGNASNKSAELKAGGNYHRQVVFYKLLVEEANKSKQFPYEMQCGEIDFVQQASDGKFKKKTIEVGKNDMDSLKTEIESMQKGLAELNFDKTEDISVCESCAFNRLCWQ